MTPDGTPEDCSTPDGTPGDYSTPEAFVVLP